MKHLLFILTFFITIVLNAQWISTSGPHETNIEAIISKGTTLFTGTAGNGGIYRSIDNGANWVKTNNGIQSLSKVYSFCIAGQKIVAGVNTDVYISSNDGDSWQKITPTNNAAEVRALGYDGTFLYAALSGSGVARSGDEGVTWTLYSNGITDKSISAILVTDSKIFIASNTGIYASADKGINWQSAATGITANSSAFKSFTKSGNDIYVCGGYGGVHKSTDNGVSWSAVNAGLQTTNTRKIFSYGNVLLCSTDGGIHKSINGGTSWTKVNNGLTTDYANNFAIAGSALFVAASARGIYKSVNDGELWSASSKGIVGSTLKTLLKSGSTLFAGAYYSGGVHSTTNGGNDWSHTYPSVSNVIQLIADGNNIYAATFGWGLFKTTNSGTAWSNLTPTLGNLASAFTVALFNNKLYVGTNGTGVFYSTDNGANWSSTGGVSQNQVINMLTVAGSKLYAATTQGVFVLSDNGMVWSATGLAGKNIITLKTNNSKIYAGTWGEGVYVSSDNGVTWNQIKNGMTYLFVYALTFDSGNNIYAATGANVYSSKDGGANWVLKNEGLPGEVYSIEVMDNYLYAGTAGYGVWKRPLSELVTSVKPDSEMPVEHLLRQNYPNPFNPTTTISFNLSSRSFVKVTITDALGREVDTIVSEELSAGSHSRKWNAYGIPSGVYFCRMQSGSFAEIKKLVLLR